MPTSNSGVKNHSLQDRPRRYRKLLWLVESCCHALHHIAKQREVGTFNVTHPGCIAYFADASDGVVASEFKVTMFSNESLKRICREMFKGPFGPEMLSGIATAAAKNTVLHGTKNGSLSVIGDHVVSL